MLQKIIKVGNSLAIILPADFIHNTGYQKGDQVLVEKNAQYKTLFIQPKTAAGKSNLTPEFFSWLEEVSDKYEKAIKELAQK